jgi:hypothetical protein
MAIDRPAAERIAGLPLTEGAGEAFSWVAIADAEVRLAQAGHPDQADLVFHTWPLLGRPYWMPPIPFVYAGYIRELLDRAAAGQDTRPGTAAEVALACSLVIDLKSAVVLAGLSHRMWLKTFPDDLAYEGQDKRTAWMDPGGPRARRSSANCSWRARRGSCAERDVTRSARSHGRLVAAGARPVPP